MDITKSFDSAFNRMVDRGWEKIYVLVDIHDTVFEACYYKKEEHKWFPYAKEALQLMSQNPRISLILWSSTYRKELKEYLSFFVENGIDFDMVNINTETVNTTLSDFSEKTYFNVGIDDKFGFDGKEDWKTLYEYMKKLK